MFNYTLFFTCALFLLHTTTHCQIARSLAMGETGFALADDESVILYNPAGLGIKNERWAEFATTITPSYRSLSIASAYQPEKLPRFGFSEYINLSRWQGIAGIDMEGIIYYPQVQRSLTVAVGTGYNIYTDKIFSNAIGLSLKYNSNYIDSKHSSLAICLGNLIQIWNIIRLGIVVQNRFPDLNHLFVIPSAAFKYPVIIKRLHLLDLSGEISSTFNYTENNYNTTQKGIEVILLRTFSFYTGSVTYNDSKYYFTFEPGDMKIITIGFGLNLFNHFELTLSRSISLSIKNLFKWKKSDLKWWRVDK